MWQLYQHSDQIQNSTSAADDTGDSDYIPDTSFPLTFNLNCFATVCPPDGVAVVVDERSRSPQRTLRTHWLRRIDGIKVEVDECCWRLGDMLGLTTW
jgi:hypothetical protein